MLNEKTSSVVLICNIILSMDRSFKISQLLEEMESRGVNDKDKVLQVLDELCDSGVIKYSEIEDKQWAYKKQLV